MQRHIIILLFVLSLALVGGRSSAQDNTPTPAPDGTQTVVIPIREAVTLEATPPPTATPSSAYDIHIVQPGETLYVIAVRYGTTTRELADLNGITNRSLIYFGQRLRVPTDDPATAEPDAPTATPTATATPTRISPEITPEVTPDAAGATTYIVQPGDSLYRIAVRNDTTVSAIVSLNNLRNRNVIYTGQRLLLPAGSVDGEAERAQAIDDLQLTRGVQVFWGVGQDYEALSGQVMTLGVDWVKLQVDWADIEPTQGARNFEALDEAIDIFVDADVDILLTLVGSPAWAVPSATDYALSTPLNMPPDDLDTFGDFAGAVAGRYQGRVQAYEIWSAPNIRLNWLNPQATIETITDDAGNTRDFINAGMAETAYIDLLTVAYNAIKAVDVDAQVITAGLAPVGYNDGFNAIDTFVFLQEMLSAGALNVSDALGVQLDGYNNPPSATLDTRADTADLRADNTPYNESYHFYVQNMLDNYRLVSQRNGGADVPLWVTRIGWGTAANSIGEPRPDLERYVTFNSPQDQADYLAEAFALAQDIGYVEQMMVYNLNGCAVNQRNACFYSLIGADGVPRPAFNAIEALD
jgi:LysM repeat protein